MFKYISHPFIHVQTCQLTTEHHFTENYFTYGYAVFSDKPRLERDTKNTTHKKQVTRLTSMNDNDE